LQQNLANRKKQLKNRMAALTSGFSANKIKNTEASRMVKQQKNEYQKKALW
jgi:hypothetical protein